MFAPSSSVGTTTSTSAISDQMKKYRVHQVTSPHYSDISSHKLSNGYSIKPSKIEPLVQLCLNVLSNEFQHQPNLDIIPIQFLPEIMRRLPLNMDITLTAPTISDENYWKRCCMSRKEWKNLQVQYHGLTWKQLYLEKQIQEILENFNISQHDYEHLILQVKACQDYIFTIQLEQLLSHIDLNEVFSHLRNLTTLKLTYGVKNIGMKYERILFGMKITDATNLGHIAKNTSTLTTLELPSNFLDDDLLRLLMTGLIKNTTITSLDLSHNKITNHGARLISKLLGPSTVLTSINLCDNQIHAEGGRYLSQGLKYNSSLISLNLRLNRLTDEGAQMLLEGLMDHTTLQVLNLSCNVLGSGTAEALSELLAEVQCNLRYIDLSGNVLTEEDGDTLYKEMESNKRLIAMDLRSNNIPENANCLEQIATKLRSNEVSFTQIQDNS